MKDSESKASKSDISPAEARAILESLGIQPKKKKSIYEEVKSGLGLGARRLATGAASIGDVMAIPANLASYGIKRVAGMPHDLAAENNIGFPSQKVKEGLEKTFDITEQPSKVADYLTAPLEFIGGGAGAKVAVMGKELLKKSLPQLMKNSKAGLIEKIAPKTLKDYGMLTVGGAGSKVGEEQFETPLGKTVGSIGGTLLATSPFAIASKANQIAKASPSKMVDYLGYQPETHKAFKDIGLDPRLSEVITNKPVKSLDMLLSKLPSSSDIAEKAAEKRAAQIEELIPKTYQQEKVVLPEELDTISKAGARNVNKEVLADSAKLFDQYYSRINPKKIYYPEKTAEVMKEHINALSPQAQEKIKNSESGKLFTDFLDHLEQGVFNNETLLHEKGLPVGDLRNVYLTELNDFAKKGGDFGKIATKEQGKVKHSAGILKKELDDLVEMDNPGSKEKLEVANKHWADYQQNSKFYIDGILDAKEAGFSLRKFKNDLNRGTTKNLVKLTEGFTPDQKNILSNTLIEEYGMKNGTFGLPTLANNLNKLKPHSLNVLLQGLPRDSQNKLKSVIKAFGSSRTVGAEGNPSGTAYMMSLVGLMTGIYTKTIETGATLIASRALAKLINNPKYLDKLYEISQAKTPEQAKKIYESSYNLFQPVGQLIQGGKKEAKPAEEEELEKAESEPKGEVSKEEAIKLLQNLQEFKHASGGRIKPTVRKQNVKSHAGVFTKKDRYKHLYTLMKSGI